jgi:hypothetical protein
VQDSQAGSIIIVLDALDECAESEFEDLMYNIESQSHSCRSSHIRLRHLLTSRPYKQIVAKFRGLLKSFPRIHIPGRRNLKPSAKKSTLLLATELSYWREKRDS